MKAPATAMVIATLCVAAATGAAVNVIRDQSAPASAQREVRPTLMTNELAVAVPSTPEWIRGGLTINDHGCFSLGNAGSPILAPAFSNVARKGNAIRVRDFGIVELGDQLEIHAVIEDIDIATMGTGDFQNKVRDCLGQENGQVLSIIGMRRG